MSVMDSLDDDVLFGVADALDALEQGKRLSELDTAHRHHVRTFLILVTEAKEGTANVTEENRVELHAPPRPTA